MLSQLKTRGGRGLRRSHEPGPASSRAVEPGASGEPGRLRFRRPSTQSLSRAVAETLARCGEGEGFTTLSGVHSQSCNLQGQNEKQGQFKWNVKNPAHLNIFIYTCLFPSRLLYHKYTDTADVQHIRQRDRSVQRQ